jgi:hypothetical protein
MGGGGGRNGLKSEKGERRNKPVEFVDLIEKGERLYSHVVSIL